MLLSQTDVLRLRDFDGLVQAVIEEANFKLPAAGLDMRDLEKSLVEQALQRSRGNRTGAGKLLGMNRDQVRYRIDQFGLESKKKSLS